MEKAKDFIKKHAKVIGAVVAVAVVAVVVWKKRKTSKW